MQNKGLTDQETSEQEMRVLALGMDMWEEHFRHVQFLEPETYFLCWKDNKAIVMPGSRGEYLKVKREKS